MSIPERICPWCHTLSTIAIVVPDEPYLGEVPEIVTTKPNGDSRTGESPFGFVVTLTGGVLRELLGSLDLLHIFEFGALCLLDILQYIEER